MIVSIAAQKGGTGKTTTTATLGAGLFLKGYKVLLIDLDQQGNLTNISGGNKLGPSMLGVLSDEIKINAAIQNLEMYDLIPANKKLVGAETILKETTGGEYRLKEALEPIKGNYDFILLDTPPALGPITINAMTASDLIIIPSQADVLNIDGIHSLYESYKLVKKYCNPSLSIGGILLTKHNDRAIIRRDLEEMLREKTAPALGTKVYKTRIRETVAVNEAQYMKMDIFTYAPKSNAAIDYKAFVDEFIGDLKSKGKDKGQ